MKPFHRRAPPAQSNEELCALAQSGDRKARDQLVIQNMAFVRTIANRFVRRCLSLEIEDLMSLGAMGIMAAAEKYVASNGTKFLTYAHWWIEAKIRRGIQEEDRLIQIPALIANLIVSGKLRREWDQLVESGLSDEEVRSAIAKSHHWEFGTVDAAERAMRHSTQSSLDATLSGLNDAVHDDSLYNVLPDPKQARVDDRLDEQQDRAEIRRIVSGFRDRLEPRARAILDRRLMATGDEESLQDIGESFGLTRERIRQIEIRLLARLRVLFQDRAPSP